MKKTLIIISFELIKHCGRDTCQYTDTDRKIAQKFYYKVCSFTQKDGKKKYGDTSDMIRIPRRLPDMHMSLGTSGM